MGALKNWAIQFQEENGYWPSNEDLLDENEDCEQCTEEEAKALADKLKSKKLIISTNYSISEDGDGTIRYNGNVVANGKSYELNSAENYDIGRIVDNIIREFDIPVDSWEEKLSVDLDEFTPA